MIPYSYNMVDMGGIDLAEANCTVVPGIYEKIVEAMNLCGDLILYNWKFAGILISPSACSVLPQTDSILINGLIQVTELDEITVLGIEPPPPPILPVEPLEVIENGLYEAVPPRSGFNPVNVNVSGADVLTGTDAPTSNIGQNGSIYLRQGLLGALLRFDSSVTDDEIPKTWNTVGNPRISSEQFKFGGGSLYLDGSSYLQSAVDADDFDFSTGDFTIACWIYPITTNRAALFAMSSDCKIGVDLFFGSGSANIWLSSNGSSWNVIQSDNAGANTGRGTIALQANTWTHIALVRYGRKVTMYVNGQIAREVNLSSDVKVAWSGNDGFRIGAWGNVAYKFNGYIDDFCVLKDIAMWREAFIPPASPISADYIITEAYLKVNDAWQSLIGSYISDVDL